MHREPDSFSTGRGDESAGTDLEALFVAYVDRINDGEKLDAARILEEHPEQGPEIVEHLRDFIDLDPDDRHRPPLGILGDYTLRRQIGRGGMGVVYEAWENSMARRVALKVLPAGIAADSRASARFLREAQTAGKLSHPNVVPVYFTGVREQTPFYAMEYVEGETLAQVLARVRDAEPETQTPFGKKDSLAYFSNLADVFADVADGLQHAHSRGVTHRDIKPSNLILDSDGRLRILDFGLARLEGQESLTLSGDFVGTPLYMSPEQARRKKIPVDHRTDVYSLGATMYEAICGRPPFRGKDHADTLSQIIERDPAELRSSNPHVPKDLETIVLKCLRKDAGDRYGTAEALGQDLRRFVRGDAVEARRLSRTNIWLAWVWGRRRRVSVALLFFGLALAAVLGGISGYRHDVRARQNRYEELVLSAVAKIALADHLQGEGSKQSLLSAQDDLTRALKLIPDSLDSNYHLARTYAMQGQTATALALLAPLEAEFFPAAHLAYTARRADQAAGRLDVVPELREARGWESDWQATMFPLSELNASQVYTACERLLSRIATQAIRTPYVGMSLEVRMAAGKAYLKDGRNVAAFEHFTRVRERWPTLSEPAILCAIAAYRLDDRTYGESLLERTFEQSRDSDYTATQTARVCIGLGLFELGLKSASQVKNPALRAALESLNLVGLERHEEARSSAIRAMKIDHSTAEAHKALGRVLGRAGKLDQAILSYTEAARHSPRDRALMRLLTDSLVEEGNYALGLGVFKEIATTHGETPLLLLYRGRFHRSMTRYDAAISDLSRLRDVPGFETDAHFYLATVYFRTKQFERAIASVSRAIEFSPNYATAYANRATYRYWRQDARGALQDIESALRNCPEDSSRAEKYAYARADLLRLLKRFEAARTELERLIERKPDEAFLRLELGFVHAESGNLDSALECWDQAVKLDPQDPHIWWARGDRWKAVGEPRRALEDYAKAASLSEPDAISDPGFYNNRGSALKLVGDLAGAMADYNRCLAADPEYKFALLNRSEVKCDLGDFDGALEDCARALEVDPGYSIAIFYRGRVLALAGRNSEAIKDLHDGVEHIESVRPYDSADRWLRAAVVASTVYSNAKSGSAGGPVDRSSGGIRDPEALKDEALRSVEMAARSGLKLHELQAMRGLEAVKNEPRFQAVVEGLEAAVLSR